MFRLQLSPATFAATIAAAALTPITASTFTTTTIAAVALTTTTIAAALTARH